MLLSTSEYTAFSTNKRGRVFQSRNNKSPTNYSNLARLAAARHSGLFSASVDVELELCASQDSQEQEQRQALKSI